MTAFRFLTAALFLCLLFQGTAAASSNDAVVKNDAVPLYSRMSSDSAILKPLTKGESVAVAVEIDGPEGAWCGVIEEGETSVSGYVLCKDLERTPHQDRWQHVGSTGGGAPDHGREANETNVSIRGNQVIVPVKLEYRGRTVEARLVLDTGASVTMINTEIADRLGIEPAETAQGDGQVVGGTIIPVAFTRLGYVSVGPHKKKNMIVAIMEEKGLREERDGLLGMDFLKGVKYFVDFGSGVIRWGH